MADFCSVDLAACQQLREPQVNSKSQGGSRRLLGLLFPIFDITHLDCSFVFKTKLQPVRGTLYSSPTTEKIPGSRGRPLRGGRGLKP